MPETMKLGDLPVALRGVFDLEAVYRTVLSWYETNQMQYFEKLYKDKPAAGGTREMEINMLGDVKLDEFHKWNVGVTIKVFDGVWVEAVDAQGNKRKMMRGRIVVMVTGSIDRDYQKKFEGDPFLLKLRKFMINKMQGNEENFKFWDAYFYRLVGFQTKIKEVLGTQTVSNAYA